MDRIARLLRIGDVALHAAHGQRAGQRTAPADADQVAQFFLRRRLAHHAPIDALAGLAEMLGNAAHAIEIDRAFLVAGQQQRHACRDDPDAPRRIVPARSSSPPHRTFMSAAPRPYRRPSRMVGSNGGDVHSASGPLGTTSVCPRNASTGSPCAVRRPQVLDVAVTQVLATEIRRARDAARSHAGNPHRPASPSGGGSVRTPVPGRRSWLAEPFLESIVAETDATLRLDRARQPDAGSARDIPSATGSIPDRCADPCAAAAGFARWSTTC